jgi:predicted RND superfamily exporter protein
MLDALLERLLTGARIRAKWVAALAIVLAGIGAALLSRVSFDADMLRLLPRKSPAVQSFRTFLRTFGSLDHLYVVFESAEGIDDHKTFVNDYVAALRGAPEIESVDAQLFEPGKDWAYLSDRVLFLLGPAGAADALARFRPPRLDVEIAHARDLLTMPSEQIKAYVQQDPLGLLGLLRTRLEKEKGAIAFDPTKEGYVSADGRARLVIVKPRGAPFDTDFCKTLFARMSQIEQKIRAADVSEAATISIVSAGAYRISLESERLIRRDGIVNSVGSLVLLLAIVFAVFRTPWVLILGTLPLALAALLSLGVNGVLRGSLSPATSGSAGMLFGLGIDGVVLLYVRYLEEREAGRDEAEATRRMSGTASSVVLAQMTSVATFLALLLLDFPTLEDLGGLVGIGMLLVCPLTLILLPALFVRTGSARLRRAPATPRLGEFVTRHSRAIVVAGVVLTVIFGAAIPRLRIDTRLERLQPRTAGADLERDIATRFGLPQDVFLAMNENRDLEPLLEADRRLNEQLGTIDPSIVISGATLLLPPASEQARVSSIIRSTGFDTAQLGRDIRAAGERAGFRPDTFAPFLERLPRVIDPDQRITYDELLAHGLGSIVSRFVARNDGVYRSVTYLYASSTADVAALETAVRRTDPHLQLTGLTMVERELGRRFFPEFAKGITAGTLAVAILIYAVFRNWRHTILALVPTAVGFVWSAGLLALAHVRLDLFSMFATLTFVGMVVDYGIYVLYRYAVDHRPVGDVLARTGAAVAIACLTAIVGFGTLVLSSYPPLRLFGAVSIVTLTCCLAATLLFLPALLVQLNTWSRPAR